MAEQGEPFGKPSWDKRRGAWVAAADVSYFRDFGGSVQARDVDKRDPFDEEALLRAGKLLVVVDPGEKRQPPSPEQRRAWQRVLERGDALWDELTATVLAEYQLQRPARVRWWKAMYGDHLLAATLPEVNDPAGMRKLIRPVRAVVYPPESGVPVAGVGIGFWSAWEPSSFGVRVRDGRVAGIPPASYIYRPEPGPRESIDHPVFGPISRTPGAAAWAGRTRLDYFRDFASIADDRAQYRRDPDGFGRPRPTQSWDYYRGEFELTVQAPHGGPPTDRQAAALAAFRADEPRHAAGVVDAVFADYAAHLEQRRRACTEGDVDARMPRLASADGLREHMTLTTVNVLPDDGNPAGVAVGLRFVCTWDYRDAGARWRFGRVEAAGSAGVAAGAG